MEGLGEAVENVGLAQTIQNGLAKSMQRKPKFAEWAADIEAKTASLNPASLYSEPGKGKGDSRLCMNLFVEYQKSVGSSDYSQAAYTAALDAFKASPMYALLPKYLVMADKTVLVEGTTQPSGKDFEEMRPLGKGAFGAVFLVFKKDTAQPFATKKTVKAIAKQNKMIKDVLIEREVLSKMTSRFCVNLHYAYQDTDVIYLVLTLMAGGDLSFLLKQRYNEKDKTFKPFEEGAVRFYGASMACGLQAIHDAGYVYRDLKPQNVLLDDQGQVRISDMGLTANVSGGPIKQCSGTRGFWSPETIKKEAYQFQPDWWSLGVTMYCLHSDKLPFKGKTDEEKDAATVAGVIEYGHDEPKDLQEVVSALCTIDMTKRLGCNGGLAEVKKHPYFASLDWGMLEAGTLEAPIKPNVNDINAPSKSEIDKFVKPKDVEWTADDQKAFDTWNFADKDLWMDEAVGRMKNWKELSGGGGGGGGCCAIA